MPKNPTPLNSFGYYGIILVVYAKADAGPGCVIQRSEDGVTGWEDIATLPSVEMQGNHWVDRLPNDPDKTWFYRARHIWDVGDPGPWTNVVAGQAIWIDPHLDLDAKPWPATVPVNLEIDIDEEGRVSLFVDGSFRTKSIQWATNIDSDELPNVEEGELYNLDPETDPVDDDGDLLGITTVDTGVQLQPGELVRAGVRFFSREDGEGNRLATHYDLARFVDPDGDNKKLEPDFKISLDYLDISGHPHVRVILDVTDPHGRLEKIDYFWDEGPISDIPGLDQYGVWNPETPGGSRYTQLVQLDEKHMGVLAFAAYWLDADEETRVFQKILWLDVGDEANIVNTSVYYSGDAARAFVKVKGDADTRELHVEELRNGSWGPVHDPLSMISGTRFQATRRGQFSVRTEEDPRLFRVWGKNDRGLDGPKEEVGVSSRLELDSDGGPVIILEQLNYIEEDGVDKAQVVVDVQDPFENLDLVRVFSEKGPVNGVPAFWQYDPWDPETEEPFVGRYVTAVTLDQKHMGLVAIAASWIDDSGRNRITQKLLWIDIDENADILFVEVFYDNNGKTAVVKVKGDADTDSLRVEEFRSGSWGGVFEPALPIPENREFASSRRGTFSVQTEEDPRQFRVWGINRSGEPGEFEEFSVSSRLEVGEPEDFAVQIQNVRWVVGESASSSFFDRQIALDLILRNDVRSLQINFGPLAHNPAAPQGTYTLGVDGSTTATLAGVLVRDEQGNIVDFPEGLDANIQVVVVARDGNENLIGQRFGVISTDDRVGQMTLQVGSSDPVTGSALMIGSGLSLSVQSGKPLLSASAGGAGTISTNNGLTGGGSTSENVTIGLTGQALALHNMGNPGFFVRTESGFIAARVLQPGTGISISNENGASGNPQISVATSGVHEVIRKGADQDIHGTKVFASGGRLGFATNAATTAGDGSFHVGSAVPTHNRVLNYSGHFRATQLFEGNTRVLTADGSGATGTWGISITGNAATATSAVTASNLSRSVSAGNGLQGGGPLNGNVTITMRTPLTIGAETTNVANSSGHSHALEDNIARVFVETSTPSGTPARAGDIWIVV